MGSKALQSTIEIAGVLSPSLQNAINKAVSRLEEMSQEALDTAGAAEKLCAEMDAQESVLKSLQKGYADYIVSGQESSDEAQTLARKIQELSGELDQNRDTLKAAEQAAKKLADTQEDTGDTYSRLEDKIRSQQDELEKLRREYANVVLEQGKTSTEAKQLESKINSLSGELGQNEKKLRGVADAAEEAGNKARNSGDGFTVLKGAIADLAADAIQAAIDKFKELALEGDAALGKLQARTGTTKAEMAGLEDVMYDVYNAGYGDSIEGVSDALSTVIQMTDNLDKASLETITKNAIALEDIFGFDVTESMRAANSLMDQFGITSDQAFNLIVQGAQNGLNQNDDLLDTINEYSVQFKNAGYSADDMFNMLANGVESGTWSVDKLGDAVKEFNIRMSDGSAKDAVEALGFSWESVSAKWSAGGDSAKEVFNMLINELDGLENTTSGYNIGVGLMGTMYEDLGQKAVLALSNTEGAISKTNAAMAQADASAYDTLGASLTELGRTLEAEILRPLVDAVTPAVKLVVDFLINNMPLVKALLAGIAATVISIQWGSIVSGITGMAGAVQSLFTLLAANPIGLVVAGIVLLISTFTQLWQNCEGFRNFWIGLWDGIKSTFSAAGDWIKNAWSSVVSFFTDSEWLANLRDKFTNIWNSITSFLSGVWQTIKNVVQVGIMAVQGVLSAAFQIITLPFQFIWQNCKDTVTQAWTAIKDTIGSKISEAKAKIDSVTGQIQSAASTAWSNISSAASTAWSGIRDSIGSKIEAAKAKVSIATTAIKSAATAAWSSISSAAAQKWENIRNTISSKLSAAKSAVSSAMSNITSTMSSKLGSAFSTVTDKFGKIYDKIKEKMQAAKDAVGNAIKALKEKFNFSWSLPKLKLPHFKIDGKFSLNPPSVPHFSVEWYKDGGILTQPTIFGAMGGKLLAGGEAGAEAVLPLSVLWDKMEAVLRRILSGDDSTGETSDAGLTRKAGELLTLDNFSLGSLANNTSTVIYYDFSNFTWSPQIQTGGTGDDEDDFMAKLRAHEAEFFDWLEEFIQMREVALYGA